MYPATTAAPVNEATRQAQEDAALSPRFYTTDFEAMDRIDIGPVRAEWNKLMDEFRRDDNSNHFSRGDEFDAEVKELPEALRKEFIDFLVSSCTSEFSGCVLYADIKKRVPNPDIREVMGFMARDESRHAGFINQSLKGFGLGLDLAFLRKAKKYTFFKPKFIFYATYLSEKIGYWRYIAIYRHLQENPESKIFPIFNFFENWCQDENRHGDFFDALMKAQPDTVRGLQARLWCRFFLLAVFATMYVRDVARKEFYEALGLDARAYDKYVIDKTNETSARVFPVVLDVRNPRFWVRLERLVDNNAALTKADQSNAPAPLKALRKLPYWIANGAEMAKLFLMKPIRSEAFQPAVR